MQHVWINNVEHEWVNNIQILHSVTEEKDLWVNISKDMKATQQCTAARNKVYGILGLTKITLVNINEAKILKLYKAFVHPN